MHDDSGLSYSTASQRMGRTPQYISALLQSGGNPQLDTCTSIANAFGFRLIVRGDLVFYSIRHSDEVAVDGKEISAKHAVRCITDACQQSNYAISKALGRSTAYISSIISKGTVPTIETFIAIAEICGDEVLLKGHSKTYYLSKRARFSAAARAAYGAATKDISNASSPKEQINATAPTGKDRQFSRSIYTMSDITGISLQEASRRSGHSAGYIANNYLTGPSPRLDACCYIASGFGFDLVVKRRLLRYRVVPSGKHVKDRDQVPATVILSKCIDVSPLRLDSIASKTGLDRTTLYGFSAQESLVPAYDDFIAVVLACGFEATLENQNVEISLATLDSREKRGKTTQVAKSAGSSEVPSWEKRGVELQSLVEMLEADEGPATRHDLLRQNAIDVKSTRDDISHEHAGLIDSKAVWSGSSAPYSEETKSVFTTHIDDASSTDEKEQLELANGMTPSTATPISVRPAAQTEEARQSISREKPMTREEQKLADYKRRLLDLSMRNNLLNYRDKKTGTIRVITPDMATTYRRIVMSERPMTFRESNPEDGERARASSDTTIVTERTGQDLIRSLRRLDTVARTSIDEQGINILYLAFGMLHWIDDAQKEHFTPLVMAPVRLTKTSARSNFVLQSGDDDPVVNPTLSYYLEQTHKIALPDFEKEDQLQRFLITVGNLVQGKEGWSVSTDVVLSTFQFQKLSMYHDLEARSEEILAHPIVRAIMGDGSALGDMSELENPDSFKPTDTYQVVDADASQQAAILAAHAGQSFVLQGPPGTGKSQTITNIIADCLGSGKKVLFVSEKKAALDVVHRRLTQTKLDDFCLVLHSNKAGKKEVLGQLDHTLGLYGTRPRMSAAASTRLDNMVRLRDELNGYAVAIYEPIEPLGKSPYEVIGAVTRLERDGVPWMSCRIEDIQLVTPSKMSEMENASRAYARELSHLGELPSQNPWTTFGITKLEYGESGEVIRTFSQVARGAHELMELWSRLITDLELDISPTLDALDASAQLVEDIAAMPTVPHGVSEISASDARRLVEDWGQSSDSLEVSSREVLIRLAELAKLDPDLDVRVDASRLAEGTYVRKLAEDLQNKLNGIAYYATWQHLPDADVSMVVAHLKSKIDSYERHKGTIVADYHPEVLDIDFVAMESRFKTEYQSFFKRVFGQHGEDIRTLAALRRSSSQVDDEEALRILALLHDLLNEERRLDERSDDYESVLGACYRGMRTDFTLIARKRDALNKARSCLSLLNEHGELAEHFSKKCSHIAEVFDSLYDPASTTWDEDALMVVDSLEQLREKYEERGGGIGLGNVIPLLAEKWVADTAQEIAGDLKATLRRRKSAFKKAADRADGADLGKRNLDQLANSIEKATSAGETTLNRAVAFARARKTCTELGLDGFIDAMGRDPRAMEQGFLDQYDRILQHTVYRIWLGSVALAKRPALREFSAREQERRVAKFSNLDAEQLDIGRVRVLAELFPRIPSSNVRARGKDEISILLRELNKKARIRPIRKLFADIPHAVLALKPCLMMSPLSVSTYLESATFQFDTVIFDEASQVRTEDALGVISRGKQVIIAGDSKQLPPTNFFAATVADDEAEFDDDYYEQAGSFDSVLDEAALLNPISLKWHYRSRDESLITFSNEEIYDGDLFTFPSNRTSGRDSGVEYVYVPNGVYEGSRKGNAIEAKRVVDLIMAHFATYETERSLGVIALGENQARVIEDELIKRRLASPDTERFFDTAAEEAFFIKNLENVQGDERDTIILSIGYAKGPNGRLSHNFGPINLEGGERRLNVAVTRARVNLKLVTSLDPSEIDANRVSNVGPRVLKDYLTYAKIGPSDEGGSLHREYGYVDEDAFAEVIRDVLSDAGFEVEERVGRSGCKVDLAIRHPEHTDCFCIGIVCDGDSYHAATTARDRDRLRTQVLKGMGWSLYHVWSRAWLQDSERQRDLLIDAANKAIESFVPPTEREPVDNMPVVNAPEEEQVNIEQEAIEPSEQEIEPIQEQIEFLEIEHAVDEHRYGFQSYPEYQPPRRSAISDVDLLKQFIYAQAPFSLEYFLQKFRLYCYPKNQRMNEGVRRTGMGYLRAELRDTVVVRKEHECEYVFRRDQRSIIPRVAGSRSVADISTSELREGVLSVLRGYVGELDRKGLIEETSAAFEFPRRTRQIEQRISEAIDDLLLYGKARSVGGLIIPMNR